MSAENNPFTPPQAVVGDYQETPLDNAELVLAGIRNPASAGVAWIGEGWRLFKQSIGLWIAISVIFFVLMMILGVIPLVNLLANFLMPLFIAGLMIGARELDQGRPLELGHLFAGFQKNAGSLVLVSLLYMAGVILIIIVAGIFGALTGALAAFKHGAFGLGVVLVVLIALALLIPLAMAFWFAPALVVFHDVSAWNAMRASFVACIKNFVPFFVQGLVMLVLMILATLPLFLGWLALWPVMFCTMYASYKGMFLRPAAQ